MKQLAKNPAFLGLIPSSVLMPKTCANFSSSEFLSAITHDLKTPLNAIIGFSDVLKEEIGNVATVEECLEYVAQINRAAVEMNELVHDLLDVGAVASGNFSVDLAKKIEICEVVKRAMRLNQDYAIKRKVSLKMEIIGEIAAINLDEKRMKQVLTNLISNAVKYSSEGCEVKTVCEVKNNQLEISVIDQGFGMSEQQVEIAFEKYGTIQNPNSGSVDSFGLGLPIVRHLVEMQNGEIEVSSKAGKGTQMKLKFPYLSANAQLM
jgi:two-component system cell cycle sensor histidine kinase PleC